MTTEKTRHIILHTHHSNGNEIFEPFRHPETEEFTCEDLEQAKAGAATLNKKHNPHKFAAYTLVKR